MNDNEECVKGPTIKVLCKKPVTGTYPNEKGVTDVTADKILGKNWPVCEQLPCICLGDPDLPKEKAMQVLRFECNSTTNFDSFIDVSGKAYIIPKVEHCGTYKPNSPTPGGHARCECTDLDPRKLLFKMLNEYQSMVIHINILIITKLYPFAS